MKPNGITREPTRATLDNTHPEDDTTTETAVYPPGIGNHRVQVSVVRHGGHTWPGRPGYAAERLIGKASLDFDATRTIWKFFKSCPSRVEAATGR